MRESNDGNPIPKGMRFWFGIFMILIYLGVGMMFILNFFQINATTSCVIGVLLCLYGIWRGVRLFKGMN